MITNAEDLKDFEMDGACYFKTVDLMFQSTPMKAEYDDASKTLNIS